MLQKWRFHKLETDYAYLCREFAYSTYTVSDVRRLQNRALNFLRSALSELGGAL